MSESLSSLHGFQGPRMVGNDDQLCERGRIELSCCLSLLEGPLRQKQPNPFTYRVQHDVRFDYSCVEKVRGDDLEHTHTHMATSLTEQI